MKLKKVTWHKLNDYWHQKIYINETGQPIYTYHYKSKLNQADKTVKIDIKEYRQLTHYLLIEKDLRDIKLFIKQYEKYMKQTESVYLPNNTPVTGIVSKALLTAIVTHYFRCFPGSKKRGLLQTDNLPDKFAKTHDFLKKLRNLYICHSDFSEYEGCNYLFLIPPEKKAKKINKEVYFGEVCELFQAFGFLQGKDNYVSDINELIEFHQKSVLEKIDILKKKIQDIFLAIEPLKLYSYIKQFSNNDIVLNQQIIKKLTS